MRDWFRKAAQFSSNQALVLITILAFTLRIFQLGADSLWFDEIGVGLAIRAPDFPSLIAQVRQHVMAMPLDYLLDWFLLRSCGSEACLRLPAAIFGTLTVPLAGLVIRPFAGTRTGLWTAFLLAVTPIHIFYSQELRFYASLVFFYWLVLYCLYRAIWQPGWRNWLFVLAASITGAYFHIYVLLALLSGLFWIGSARREKQLKPAALTGFCLTVLLAGAAVLPGFLYFRGPQELGMFSWAESIVNLPVGLGWWPVSLYPRFPDMLWFLGICILQIIGFRVLLKTPEKSLVAWCLSNGAQILLILLVNLISQYSFRARQILFLVPFFCMLSALGIQKVIESLRRVDHTKNPARDIFPPGYSRRWSLLLAGLTVAGLAFTLVGLHSAYAAEKSNRREVSLALIDQAQTGGQVWFTPEWEDLYFGYYGDLLGQPDLKHRFTGVTDALIEDADHLPDCWVFDTSRSADFVEALTLNGFDPVINPSPGLIPDAKSLWCR